VYVNYRMAMDDREVVAAIAAGSPAGIAAAYDRYAADLYSYCQWMLDHRAAATEALQDAFVVASATIGNLADPTKLRPWMYALARQECQRRLRTACPAHNGSAGQPYSVDKLSHVAGDLTPTEMRAVIRGILAAMPPREREVIELSLRHNLHDDDLAEALEVSWSRAHALTERARGRLEKALGALLLARTGREACPELNALLLDWDGHLTEQARDLIAGHVDRCQICAGHRLGRIRPAALSGLMPLDPLPIGLRAQVLRFCSDSTPDTVAYQHSANRSAGSIWLARVSQVFRLVRRDGVRRKYEAATATAVVAIWVAVAVGFTVHTVVSSHPVRSRATSASTRPAMTSPSAMSAPTAFSSSSASAAAKRSPSISQSTTIALRPVESTSAFVEPSLSPSHSPKPSRSASPKPSGSPSPKSSKSPSPSPSPSVSSSPSPSPSPSPAA
jgi:RNA polymerase sigma factor (sigma-70 family)